jgi:hypothetical protein
MNSFSNMNRTKFANRFFFFQIFDGVSPIVLTYCSHLSVSHVFMITSTSAKKKKKKKGSKFSWGLKSEALTVLEEHGGLRDARYVPRIVDDEAQNKSAACSRDPSALGGRPKRRLCKFLHLTSLPQPGHSPWTSLQLMSCSWANVTLHDSARAARADNKRRPTDDSQNLSFFIIMKNYIIELIVFSNSS